MLPKLINHSPDLQRLRDEGYFLEIKGGFLLLKDVPYVNEQKQVKNGTLISSLNMAGNIALKPDTHVVYFDGEYPCQADGMRIDKIINQSSARNLGHGITAKYTFSSKPTGGYNDYHHKMTTYASILAGPAAVLKPGTSPKIFRTPDKDEECVFNYVETASDRAGIGALTQRLTTEKMGIIGLGGTGSYVLDGVAKAPVQEIHLFDDDLFLQHNAFRAPGASSIEELRKAPMKVNHFATIYSKMHRHIIPHAVRICESNIHLLDGLSFVFVCIDSGKAKQRIFQKLEEMDIPFIDAGMGLYLADGSLGGILRVTASTPDNREHIYQKQRISFADNGEEYVYTSNIQVADLNLLNAAMALIKWKKIRGFYWDSEQEYHSMYTIDSNTFVNAAQ